MVGPARGKVGIPHVLFADDNPDIRGLVEISAARDPRFDAEIVENGNEALERWRTAKAQGRPFALIVLDGSMPDRSGYDVAEEIRKEDPEVKIVFFTAFDGPISLFRAGQVEASAFLHKPEDACKLTATVGELLEQGSCTEH